MSSGRRRPARVWALVAVAVWCLAGCVLGASLLGRHLLPFRVESGIDKLAAVAALQPRGETSSPWTAVHVLYGECRCSHRVVAHLLEGQRPTGFVDVVLWAGKPTPELDEAARRGMRVVVTDTRELARLYGVEAAPLLVVVDPGGGVRYAGGYGTSKQSAVLADAALMDALRAEQPVAALPLYGCASSEELRASLLLIR